MVKLQQYYILKLSTNFIKRKNYNLELSLSRARKNGQCVSIGDSQMLRSLRFLKNQEFDQDFLNGLLIERKRIRKKKSSQINISRLVELEKQIDGILYVPEIISIFVENVKDYQYLGKNGFYLNSKKYVRFLCGAGQARRNNVLFISEDYEFKLKSILNNDRKDIEIVPAKFNAYFSLASSATLPVSDPYFAVVPDYEVIRSENVDYITEHKNEDDSIEEKKMDIEFNLWDGQGIISPKQARIWSEELELDYIPSYFIVRSNFIKGMLCVIDFHEFSEEIGNHYITDVWGDKINVRDMDIILTQSQFKLWNAFDSSSDFVHKCRKNHLGWGISRVTPKEEKKYTNLNYQFIQALNIDQNQIESLSKKTIEYFKNILQGDIYQTIIYLLGNSLGHFDSSYFDKSQDNIAKSLILNNKLIDDPFIKSYLRKSLNKKIKESYIGNLIVEGQYTMMVSDPFAFLQYLFNLPIGGLLKKNEYYSSYWINKKVNTIAALRAPLTWRSEVNILNLKESEDINHWYAYLNNCVVYNVHGVDGLIQGGSDFDGDIICLTNSQEVIEGAYGGLPIYYSSEKAQKTTIKEDELYLVDSNGFDSKVGFVTNCGTTAYSLLTEFDKNSLEYKETINRLKRFRKEQGAIIDGVKGLVVKPFPVHWTKWKRVDESLNDEEKEKLEFSNKIVINKRPLFMRWVYSSYNRKYEVYNKKWDADARMKLDKRLTDILENNDKTTEENDFLLEYFKYHPFIDNSCTMNKVCKFLEKEIKIINCNLKNLKTNKNIKILKNNSIPSDADKIKKMENLYKKYRGEKLNFREIRNSDGKNLFKTIDQFNRFIRQEANAISSNSSELANLAVDICYVAHESDNKQFAWFVFGDDIVKNIYENRQEKCYIPKENLNGNIEFLGNKYSLQELDFTVEEFIYEDF